MAGGILQLVANGSQNIWLDHNPQITFFKRLYRRHTPFATETVPVQFKTKLDFGGSSQLVIPSIGDLVHRIYFSFEIPELTASFLSTKSEDICKMISTMSITDDIIRNKIMDYTNNTDRIEFDSIFNLIDETLENYQKGIQQNLDILKKLQTLTDPIGTNGLIMVKNNILKDLENDFYLPKEIIEETPSEDYLQKYKIHLMNVWMDQKKEYFLIYELLKLIYLTDKRTIRDLPLINTENLTNYLLHNNIFYDLIPNKEILLMHVLKNIPENTYPEERIMAIGSQLKENLEKAKIYHNIYNLDKKIPPISSDSLDNMDTHYFLNNVPAGRTMDFYYDFGPAFHDMLNTYHTIINMLNSLATTTPIVVAKVFAFCLKDNHNIYKDLTTASLAKNYFPTIIDPNFRIGFMSKLNVTEKPADPEFLPINFNDSNKIIYPNHYINAYISFVNDQANTLFHNIKSSLDILFEAYADRLFSSTDKLFFNNSVPLTNIYGYLVPEHKETDGRIANVFNANIWYFYFFKYLDMLDEVSFTNFVNENIILTMTTNGSNIMKNLITLLKINIEYYMNEISYLLNNLYATSPSANPSDSMKNYVPVSHHNNHLLAITLIFHRNHVPTILEMFQFIYYFIDNITVDKINTYLDIGLNDVDPGEMSRIRQTIKLFYYKIFQYFMNTYDKFSFEAPANFSTDEFGIDNNLFIQKYVNNFLLGNSAEYGQFTLRETIAQMEFYFMAEMLNMRQLQKFYYNIFSNKPLLAEKVGSTTSQILNIIHSTLVRLDNDFVPQNTTIDPVRKYWDQMYQHNINGKKPDKLYYSTFNTNRFSGESYLNTPYQSRDYGLIKLLPLSSPDVATTIPYGINPNYYNHLANDSTEISVYWQSNNSSTLNIQSNNSIFQLYDIDYFRINHNIFEHYSNDPDIYKNVDIFQLNLLILYKLTERLNNTYPYYDKYLLCWLSGTVYQLVKSISPDTNHFGENIPEILHTYLQKLEESMDNGKVSFTRTFLNDILTLSKRIVEELNTNQNIDCNGQKAYTATDLMVNNFYAHKVINDGDNIMAIINILKNNFLSQYFYYSKNSLSINKIEKIGQKFIFSNTGQILHQFLGIPEMSTLVYIYPDTNTDMLDKIINFGEKLDDFDKYLFGSLTTILNTNAPGKVTIKDILDMVNTTFWASKEIFYYLIKNDLFEYVKKKLGKYQPLLLNKILLFGEISEYFNGSHKNKFLEEDDITHLSKNATKYGINYQDFYQYLLQFAEEYNNATLNQNIIYRDLILPNRLRSAIDHFMLKDDEKHITFKKRIIGDIFNGSYDEQHPSLKYYFNYINNEYYAYIYFFINYAKNNSGSIENPLLLYDKNILTKEWDIIKKYYHSFSNVGDLFHYLFDYLWDYVIFDGDPLVKNNLGYNARFAIMVNDFHKNTDKKISDTEKKIQNDRIQNIINVLEQTNDPIILSKMVDESPENKTYFYQLDERSKIRELAKEVVGRKIIILDKMEKEMLDIKGKISNILYRNKKAKVAWVRKLAHFLVKDLVIYSNGELMDKHISDWFEIYHEISKNSGTDPGYLKMIGHREDLIIFNDQTKKSYQIVMPFIFYFNKYISSSLPLNASTNTQYSIKIKLRNLEDVAYKEEFSSFVDQNLEPIIPSIAKSQLMIEYIYLSNEERKIFGSQALEYLVDELQYNDNITITDTNLIPIYYAGGRKTKNVLQDGIKKKIEFYNMKQTVEIATKELDKNNMDLVPRNDYRLEKYMDKFGIEKMTMVHKPLPVDPYIHKKRIMVENYFQNPTKLMAVVFKPLRHTDPSMRTRECHYFDGEKQWDNYGLYPYYDLTKIYLAKKSYYTEIKGKINNPEDPVFGFIGIINQLLLQYATYPNHWKNDVYDKWIASNLGYFQETLQTIKDAYNNYHGDIIYGTNQIHLKENLLSLMIDYPIVDPKILDRMVEEVCQELGINITEQTKIFPSGEPVTKNDFINGIMHTFSSFITNATIVPKDINIIIDEIYGNYNESQTNLLVSSINRLLNLENMPYHIGIILDYCNQMYLADPDADQNILLMLDLVLNKLSKKTNDEIDNMNKLVIKQLTYKDIIHQILLQTNLIVPYRIITIIATKMSQKLNEIIDQHPVALIDYHKNLVENPKINPLLSGYLKFNDVSIMPENSTGLMWSEGQSYQYLQSTPSSGINLHSWSLDPLVLQPMGATNLSRIDKFVSVYNLHPLIDDKNPANIVTMAMSLNIIRYLSGICGKAWISTKI